MENFPSLDHHEQLINNILSVSPCDLLQTLIELLGLFLVHFLLCKRSSIAQLNWPLIPDVLCGRSHSQAGNHDFVQGFCKCFHHNIQIGICNNNKDAVNESFKPIYGLLRRAVSRIALNKCVNGRTMEMHIFKRLNYYQKRSTIHNHSILTAPFIIQNFGSGQRCSQCKKSVAKHPQAVSY